MCSLLLLVPDEGLSDGVSDSISMAILLVVDKVKPLGSNFMKPIGKNRSWKMNYLDIYFFFIVARRLFSRMIVTGIKRQGQAAPNCQNPSILSSDFLIHTNDLRQKKKKKGRKVSLLKMTSTYLVPWVRNNIDGIFIVCL